MASKPLKSISHTRKNPIHKMPLMPQVSLKAMNKFHPMADLLTNQPIILSCLSDNSVISMPYSIAISQGLLTRV